MDTIDFKNKSGWLGHKGLPTELEVSWQPISPYGSSHQTGHFQDCTAIEAPLKL